MKNIVYKILLSIIMILGLIFTIQLIYEDNRAKSDGTIYLTILDFDESIKYEGELEYFEGDSFYDILKRNFSLTCANQIYQEDPTCEYEFNTILYKGKVILGIQNENFMLITNWHQTFLAIEIDKGDGFYLATEGVSNIKFSDKDHFKIQVRNPME